MKKPDAIKTLAEVLYVRLLYKNMVTSSYPEALKKQRSETISMPAETSQKIYDVVNSFYLSIKHKQIDDMLRYFRITEQSLIYKAKRDNQVNKLNIESLEKCNSYVQKNIVNCLFRPDPISCKFKALLAIFDLVKSECDFKLVLDLFLSDEVIPIKSIKDKRQLIIFKAVRVYKKRYQNPILN